MGECPSAVRGLIGPCGMCAQCVEAERDDLAASLDTARGERDEARDEVTALRARVEALEETAEMASIDPRAGCDCAGCLYARAKGGEHE